MIMESKCVSNLGHLRETQSIQQWCCMCTTEKLVLRFMTRLCITLSLIWRNMQLLLRSKLFKN